MPFRRARRSHAGVVGRECLQIRVGTGLPFPEQNLEMVTNLTLFIKGDRLDGTLIGRILNKCPQLKRCTIHRKDNDWDAPNTVLSWTYTDDHHLAAGLRNHPTLETFSLTGFQSTCPVTEISKALGTVPHLSSVKLEVHDALKRGTTRSSSFPPEALQLLLRKKTLVRLSLLSVFPESGEYINVLKEAYLRHDGCKVHIFIQFSGTPSHRPTRFAYYIREVMELNQKGRTEINDDPIKLLKLLRHVIRSSRASRTTSLSSLDGICLLVRDNPWLCERGKDIPQRRQKGLWLRMQRLTRKRHA